MKARITMLLAAALLLNMPASFTQIRYSFTAGGLHSNWRGNGMDAFTSLVDAAGSEWVRQQGLNSLYAGVGVAVPAGDKLRIQTGLQYARTGASLRGNLAIRTLEVLGIRAGALAVSQRLEMPVLATYEIVPGLRLMAGPQANYAFKNDVRLQASILGINLLNTKADIQSFMEPLSASAVGGIQYTINDGLYIQGTYEYGLTRIAKNQSADVYQNSIRLGIGIPVGRK